MFPRFLDGLPDGSVVMCHPGFVDAELQRLDPLTTLREQEYAFFVEDAFPTCWRATASRWRKRQPDPPADKYLSQSVIPPPFRHAYMTPA